MYCDAKWLQITTSILMIWGDLCFSDMSDDKFQELMIDIKFSKW